MGYADIPLNFGAGIYSITTVYTRNYKYLSFSYNFFINSFEI